MYSKARVYVDEGIAYTHGTRLRENTSLGPHPARGRAQRKAPRGRGLELDVLGRRGHAEGVRAPAHHILVLLADAARVPVPGQGEGSLMRDPPALKVVSLGLPRD